jgi:hypothetical protein
MAKVLPEVISSSCHFLNCDFAIDRLKESYLRLFEEVLKECFHDPSLWPQD